MNLTAAHGARQYGPTFMKLAIQQAEAEGLSIADMTPEDLRGRAAAILADHWKRMGTMEALIAKRQAQ